MIFFRSKNHSYISFVQLADGRTRTVNGERSNKAAVDLILFDLQENLPVSGLSVLANHVPEWNSDKEFE